MVPACSSSAGCISTIRPSRSIGTVIGSGAASRETIRSLDHASSDDCFEARVSRRRCDSGSHCDRSVSRSRDASSTSPSAPRSSIRIRSDGSISTAASAAGSIRSRAWRDSRVARASQKLPAPKTVGPANASATDAAISFIGCRRTRNALGSPFTSPSTFSSRRPGTSHSTRWGSIAASASIGTSRVMPSVSRPGSCR